MKKYLAEFIGTLVLVLFGCGTAVVTGGASSGLGLGFTGVATVALAFGLSIVAGAYAIGDVSGCHVNPAVSLAVLISGKMSVKDFVGYVIAQILGAFAGSAILLAIINMCSGLNYDNSLGQNGFGDASALGISLQGAIVVEIILTFVFVLTILGVTSNEKYSNIAGIVIGLTLTFVHIIGIPLTGTSVNPARSLAPAVLVGGTALKQVWVFILAPLVGAAFATVVFKGFFEKDEEVADKAENVE
jgi:aquaporin Z